MSFLPTRLIWTAGVSCLPSPVSTGTAAAGSVDSPSRNIPADRELPTAGASKDYECFLANFLNRLEIFALVWGSLAFRIIFSSRLFAFGDLAASSTRFFSRPITAHLLVHITG